MHPILQMKKPRPRKVVLSALKPQLEHGSVTQRRRLKGKKRLGWPEILNQAHFYLLVVC